jgi:hypothetical protein
MVGSPVTRDPDRGLRIASVVFAVALLVHGADHLRRGTDVLSGEVMWAGTVQNAVHS